MKIQSLLLTAALTLSGIASAEVLEISVSKQSPELQGLERPVNGMTKEEVDSTFGAPQEMNDPVGDPPISKWVYRDFTVYFEYGTVLHSVLHHQQPDSE